MGIGALFSDINVFLTFVFIKTDIFLILKICCCVEDEKVSTDWLEEQIQGFEDLVQSVDVVAFNKV